MMEHTKLCKQIKKDIGEYEFNLLRAMTPSEHALFRSFPLDLDKSYIVLGNEDLLNKFRAFYLTRCTKRRRIYAQYSMYEYARSLSSELSLEDALVDKDLIFLYRHSHALTLGNSEKWLLETILNKVADRNRDGFVTVILSEQRIPFLEECGELGVINLSGAVMHETKREALDSIVYEDANTGHTYALIEGNSTDFE